MRYSTWFSRESERSTVIILAALSALQKINKGEREWKSRGGKRTTEALRSREPFFDFYIWVFETELYHTTYIFLSLNASNMLELIVHLHQKELFLVIFCQECLHGLPCHLLSGYFQILYHFGTSPALLFHFKDSNCLVVNTNYTIMPQNNILTYLIRLMKFIAPVPKCYGTHTCWMIF